MEVIQYQIPLQTPLTLSARGDQPTAIAGLLEGLSDGLAYQTLLGVTGFGQNLHHGERHRPAAVPPSSWRTTKPLAAQLDAEMREFFPENAVEYFVSYYD